MLTHDSPSSPRIAELFLWWMDSGGLEHREKGRGKMTRRRWRDLGLAPIVAAVATVLKQAKS